MSWTQEKIEATLKSVVEKAQVDAVFREKLKYDPKEVLETEAGEVIPESLRIAIVDQNDADLVITLPKIQSNELSDADLEQVAGGKINKQECNSISDGARQYMQDNTNFLSYIAGGSAVGFAFCVSKVF